MNSSLVSLIVILGISVVAWVLAELAKWLAHKIGSLN
jgi:predicted DNA-binding transcriptional regulator AlpA